MTSPSISNPAEPLPTPPPASPSPPIGDRAAQGVFYSVVQAGGAKVVGVMGQYALSWLLGSGDFGYIGLAVAVAAFTSLVAQAGIRDVLLSRWKEIDRWETPAFWMCLTLSVASMALTIAAAPAAAWFFRDDRLTPLIVILSLQNLLGGLGIVAEARLLGQLRFKLVGAINFFYTLSIMTLSVAFAAAGLGALSFILPWPITVGARTIYMWKVAGHRIGRQPQVGLWRYMVVDNAMLLGVSFFQMITVQADYFIVGRMYDKATVGRYYWAFNLSTQAMQLLAFNIAAILMPALARLQDEPARQLQAFYRASAALMLISVPACMLQATLADPMIRLLFRSEWHPAIPIVATLSLGWVPFTLHHPAMNALKAQGRFATLLVFMIVSSALFLLTVYVGARAGGAVGAAAGVAAHALIIGPLSVRVATRPLGGRWGTVLGIFARPILCGTIAYGLSTVAAWSVPAAGPLAHVARAAIIVIGGSGLYVPLAWLIARPAADEVLSRLRSLLNRATGGAGEPSDPPGPTGAASAAATAEGSAGPIGSP